MCAVDDLKGLVEMKQIMDFIDYREVWTRVCVWWGVKILV